MSDNYITQNPHSIYETPQTIRSFNPRYTGVASTLPKRAGHTATAYRPVGRNNRSLINHKQKVPITHRRISRWFYSTFTIKHAVLIHANILLFAYCELGLK